VTGEMTAQGAAFLAPAWAPAPSNCPATAHVCSQIIRPCVVRASARVALRCQHEVPHEAAPYLASDQADPSDKSLLQQPLTDEIDATANLSSDGVPPVGGGGGHSRPRDDDEGADGDDAERDEAKMNALLSKRGMQLSDLDPEIVEAYDAGIIGARAVWNYLVGTANPFGRLFLALGGGPVRARFLADSEFLGKIGIEQMLGVLGKMTAEFSVRRERIWKEFDFVMSDLVTALLADFVLVYFPAASLPLKRVGTGARSGTVLDRLVRDLPTNVFQMDRAYSMRQRLACLGFKSAQLASVGVFCALAGFAMTNLSIYVREKTNPNYVHKNERTNPARVALVYGLFVGTSSNARYQIVGGIENNIFPFLFGRLPPVASQVASTALRFSNTCVGAGHWIFFVRSFGMMRSRDF